MSFDDLREHIFPWIKAKHDAPEGETDGGDHEAGALCLDFIWDAVATQAGEDLVVAVPAKDCLFMARASDPEQIEAMTAISRDIVENGERTLTRTLFLFTAANRAFSVYGTF